MKSSGTSGSRSSSSATVPVAGRSEFMPASLPLEIYLVSDNAQPRSFMRMNLFESRLQKLS